MRLGTRRSALALAQARLVAELLQGAGWGPSEIVPILTSGDRGEAVQDKSRWVIELEQALSGGEIDLAVHSAKDLPGELGDGLALLGAPTRAAPEDVVCGAAGVDELRPGARVGTSSLRRIAQLRAAREDLELVSIRGNVDTRLARLSGAEGDLDAIVLARAGLVRLGRASEAGGSLDMRRFLPAPGQGALALEGRDGDSSTTEAAQQISDPSSLSSLIAERALARELGASCHTPLGAHAQLSAPDRLTLRAWIGLPDGSAWIEDQLEGARSEPDELARLLAARLRTAGGAELLAQAANTP